MAHLRHTNSVVVSGTNRLKLGWKLYICPAVPGAVAGVVLGVSGPGRAYLFAHAVAQALVELPVRHQPGRRAGPCTDGSRHRHSSIFKDSS